MQVILIIGEFLKESSIDIENLAINNPQIHKPFYYNESQLNTR